MAFLSNAILVIFVLVVTAIFLPQLSGSVLGLVFRGVGWLIRRRTRSRREYVVARARSEEEEHRAPRPKASSNSLGRNQAEDEDWEKVDSSGPGGVNTTSSSDTDASGDDEWDGIIGFFHPFWYGHSAFETFFPWNSLLTTFIVMQAEAANECFGRQYAQHKSAGPRQFAQSILETMR
jgi:hypothetical protein